MQPQSELPNRRRPPNSVQLDDPAGSPAPVVILGAGLTGLSAAYHLEHTSFVLVERESDVGGHARSERHEQFTFDVTGHWLHLRDPRVQALTARLFCPGDLIEIERHAVVLSHGVQLPYPFQANLYGLPLEVVQECLVGFVEAREAAAQGNGPAPHTFEDYAIARFGRGIARHFFVPYNSKLWGMHPNCLTPDWVSRYIPIPEVDELIGGAIGLQQDGLGYNPRFLYPKAGGIDAIPRALLQEIMHQGNGDLHMPSDVEEIDPHRRQVKLTDLSDWMPYDTLISTIPLPELIRRIPQAPADIQRAAAALRCVKWRYLNVATRTRPPIDYHWAYVPETHYPFFRVGVFSNAVPSMAPPGCGSLYVELNEREGDPHLPEVLQALVQAQAITSVNDVLFTELREIEYAYVVFDDAYEKATHTIHQWLSSMGVRSCGRYGAWIYNSMEDSIIQGMEAAIWAQQKQARKR